MINVRLVFGLILVFQYTFLRSMDLPQFEEDRQITEKLIPTLEKVENQIMAQSREIDSESLRLYFSLLSKEKKVSEEEIAEILGVAQSTINRFKNFGCQSDYVCQQFLKYKNKGISMSQLKEDVEKKYSHISSAEEVEDILMMAKTEYLLPSIIKKRKNLFLYFEALVGSSVNILNQCDSILDLNGKLIEFIQNKNTDSNLPKIIYKHLLNYYRGVRWVLEKDGRRFISLSEQLGWEYMRCTDISALSFSDYFSELFGFNKKKSISRKK